MKLQVNPSKEDRQGHSRDHVEEVFERKPNKRKDGTFHRDNTTPCTTHHYTPTSTARVGALISSRPGDWITPVGPGRTPTVRWGRYDGRPWVAQPHVHAHATKVTDTSVEHGWRPHKPGSGVKVRGTEALYLVEKEENPSKLVRHEFPEQKPDNLGWNFGINKGSAIMIAESRGKEGNVPTRFEVLHDDRECLGMAVTILAQRI